MIISKMNGYKKLELLIVFVILCEPNNPLIFITGVCIDKIRSELNISIALRILFSY